MAEDKEPDSTDESNPSSADEPTPESTESEPTDPESTDPEPTDEELAYVDDSAEGDGSTGDPSTDDPESADEKVPAMAGAKSRGPRKKDAPTPKQSGGRGAKRKRTTPVQFVGESVEELRKVVYPTSTQLRSYFIVVLVFVLFIIAFVSLLDLAFGWAILKVFSS